MNRTEILEVALKYDPLAEWASDSKDENCLLIDSGAAVFVLDRYLDAYEDPNPPSWLTANTRIIFPSLKGE